MKIYISYNRQIKKNYIKESPYNPIFTKILYYKLYIDGTF
jgi:hypothetical protein